MSGDEQSNINATSGEELVAIDLTLRLRSGDEERTVQQTYDLTKGEIPPDLSKYRELARQQLSTSETMEVLAVDTPTGGTDLSNEETTPLPKGNSEVSSALRNLALTGAATHTPTADGSLEVTIFPAGTELGTFQIVQAVGQGGMGVVYKAYDTSLDRHVAVKVLAPTLSRNANFIERFRREAMACGKLSHPNITHIYSISSMEDSVHYFAMEFVEGENLAEAVKRDGPYKVDEALKLVRQTALGLQEAAKAKIIHRDIKPSNLLLNETGMVKITDFGLAKARASMGHTLDLTSTGVVMGTPIYMSPEQGRGGRVDQRSDIYSLGASMFFLIYGCPPFEADSPIALILKHINDPVTFPNEREVSASVKGLLLRMLEKDLSRRIGSYEDLLKTIDRILRGEVIAEESPRRVIVLSKRGTKKTSRKGKSGLFSTSGLKATKLSVARTNIKLGRRGKAVSLLLETIQEGDPGLRAEAALLLLALYEKEGDTAGVRRMAETVLLDPPDRSAGAYAAWKLACLEEKTAVDSVKKALARYEGILKDLPEEMPREVLEAQVRRLKKQIADAERETGNTQIVLGKKNK